MIALCYTITKQRIIQTIGMNTLNIFNVCSISCEWPKVYCKTCENRFKSNSWIINPAEDTEKWVNEFCSSLEELKDKENHISLSLLPETLELTHTCSKWFKDQLMEQGVPDAFFGVCVMLFTFGMFRDPITKEIRTYLRAHISDIDKRGKPIDPENIQIKWICTRVIPDFVIFDSSKSDL